MSEIDRTAYQSESILAEGHTFCNDSWSTGLNCNQLVLGPSGSGKTRNFLKPNLLQGNASYLVLDTKGQLYREIGRAGRELPIRLIPYYAWGNRGKGEMSVWLPLLR